jgi:alcohol dehydrogenase
VRRLEFVSRGALRYVEAPEPRLLEDSDAIVRPVASTTCDLDRAIIAGLTPFSGPFAIGHEAVAEVIEVGDDAGSLVPGQLVVVPWHVFCGTCGRCRAGRTAHCERVSRYAMFGLPLGGDFGGLFSDAVRVPWARHALVPLPASVSPRAAASASDNLTDAYRAVAPGLRDAAGANVLVMGGTGSIGVYAVAFALALGASTVAYFDPFEPDAVVIARNLGAEILTEQPAGLEFPITVDASGRPEGLHAALSATGPVGRCHSVGIFFDDVPLPLSSMYMQGVTFTTERPDVAPSIPSVLAPGDGQVDPLQVFSDVISFDDAPAALGEGLRKPSSSETASDGERV